MRGSPLIEPLNSRITGSNHRPDGPLPTSLHHQPLVAEVDLVEKLRLAFVHDSGSPLVAAIGTELAAALWPAQRPSMLP